MTFLVKYCGEKVVAQEFAIKKITKILKFSQRPSSLSIKNNFIYVKGFGEDHYESFNTFEFFLLQKNI